MPRRRRRLTTSNKARPPPLPSKFHVPTARATAATRSINSSTAIYDISSSSSPDPDYPWPCQLEMNRQQLAFPEYTSNVAGIKWARKLYAPSSGTPFLRYYDTLRNTTGADIVLTDVRFGGNLGSDSNTTQVDKADGWLLINDKFAAPDHDPALGLIFDGSGAAADKYDKIYNSTDGTAVWTAPNDNPVATYENVKVPAGATVAFLHVLTVDLSMEAITPRVPLLATGNQGEVFRGLTADELAKVVNWNTADADADGVANTSDNCITDANADQADIDKDGIGNVCDSDIDGDGVSNADEAIRGTDSTKTDSDGDGKPDNVDKCPTTSGAGADGCPPFNTLPDPPVVDKTPPTTTVSTIKKAKLKAFKQGVKAKVTCSEACSVVAELVASAKTAKIAKAYNLQLARKTLASGTGTRSIKLVPNKKLLGKAKKFTVQLEVTTKDAAGNVATKTVSIKVA